MEGRGNLEFVALFPVPGSRRSHGRVRHIDHIPKCPFRTPVSEALTMNNFFFAAEARTPSRPVRVAGVGWIRAGRERGRIRRIARAVWERSEDAIWRREREFRGTSEGERAERAPDTVAQRGLCNESRLSPSTWSPRVRTRFPAWGPSPILPRIEAE